MKIRTSRSTIIAVAILIPVLTLIGFLSLFQPKIIELYEAVTSNLPTYEQRTESSLTTDWNIMLVNNKNAVPTSWSPELKEISGGEKVDSRIYDTLCNMLDDCKAAGYSAVVVSGYRTGAEQQSIFNNRVSDLMKKGSTKRAASKTVSKTVAAVGFSEHQLGLAVDINSADTDVRSNQLVWDWLKVHCAEYGFILRYPQSKEELTGISHEPWHFRYVGCEAAAKIMESEICLEEYVNSLAIKK